MRRKRVVVAMSGGVDSSVTAALLKDQGFEVIGITLQIWERSGNGKSCCGIESTEDAKKVAYKLGIPHYVLNFRDIFKEKVISNFCAEYKAGRTPNPCIRCNQYIKFEALLGKAGQIDADYLATGHYARIEPDKQKKRYLLKKGIDSRKDQSYVLYVMTQEQLRRTFFPLGEFTKERVRQIAREKELPVAQRPESQEICFIPDNDYGEFLKSYMPHNIKPGPILNQDGKIIGEHQGIVFYTVGQREKIGIADKEPLYVTSIGKENNSICVGRRGDVFKNELIAEDINFIYMKKLEKPVKAKVKIRYLHPQAEATLIPHDTNKMRVVFEKPQWAVTPGQAAVFYDKDTVIGGGVIK